MPCLDEQTVVAFVRGGLAGDSLSAAEHHLLECAACAALIAVAAPEARLSSSSSDAQSTTRRRIPTPPPRPGAVIGRYRLLRLVGRGGVGEVYAAYDPELDRKVAIKILRADVYPDEIDAARLLREAQAVAKLSHPNVVTIYDVGTHLEQVFLTMELIEGETLSAWLVRGRRTREEILAMFLAAGRGLAAAHRAGIIHRDFKPQNVMVAADGTPRVMDFGLAARGAGANEPRLTQFGSILGTPLYMSPEQLRGEPVDPRADQFGFCVALYQAVYGERPFDGANFSELRAAVLAGRPRPPPPQSRVPPRLRAALLRGLSVDKTRRFPDIDALLSAIAQAARPRAFSPALGGAALATVAVAVVAAGVIVWQVRGARSRSPCTTAPPALAQAWPTTPDGQRRNEVRASFMASGVPDAQARLDRTSRALDAYAAGWLNSYRQNCESDQIRSEQPSDAATLRAACLDQRLSELGALTGVFAHADTKIVRKAIAAALSLNPVESCSDLAVLGAAPAPPEDAGQRAQVARARDRVTALLALAEAGHDWQALKPMGALVQEARATRHEPLLAEALLVYARMRSPFDPDGAMPLFEEAFKLGEAARNDALATEAAIQLVTIVGSVKHNFEAGERWARVAEAILERRGGQPRLRASLLKSRGLLNAARGSWRLAASDFGASVTLGEQALGSSHPELASAIVHHARAMVMLEDPARAFEQANRAIAILGAVYPTDAYEVSAARLVRGQALIDLDRPTEARADLERVRESFERVLGRDHPFLAEPMTALGQVALLERRPGDAQAILERAWEIRSTHLADGGAREETAFSLAQAVWQAAPADRREALAQAREARDGYAALPDLASKLTAVERWLAQRR